MRYIIRTTEQLATLVLDEQALKDGVNYRRVEFYEVIDLQTNTVMLGTLDRELARGKATFLDSEWDIVSGNGPVLRPTIDLS